MKFSKKVVLYRGKNAVYKFVKSKCKNLIMSAEEEEERFQLSNIIGFVINCLMLVIIK